MLRLQKKLKQICERDVEKNDLTGALRRGEWVLLGEKPTSRLIGSPINPAPGELHCPDKRGR